MNSKDLLAKLLANENLNVVRAPVSTASMDIKSRTLTLPQWKEMTNAVEEMLIGHEVGHALYTNEDYLKREEGDPAILHGYMNVIEDVRVEKKIKNKYPGLRSSFIQGYKELNERDFFELANRNLATLNLIDRINLYYKVGINCGVKFTPAEMDFVRAADRCDSIQDVYKLSKEILDYSRNVLKEKKEKQMASDITLTKEDLEDMEELEMDDVEFDSAFPDDEEGEEQEEEGRGGSGSSEQMENPTDIDESELESKTEASLRQRLSNLADTNTIVRSYKPELLTYTETIIGYKQIIGELSRDYEEWADNMKSRYGSEWIQSYEKNNAEALSKFKTDSGRVVNYLVKEFEMKKSATAYKRSTIAKTGELNVRKLHAFKLTDDLFKRITVVPDAKNHGMIFLLDWSGSMNNVIEDTVKQVINLAMFCKRAQIPFQVFAFSNGYPVKEDLDMYAKRAQTPVDYDGFTCGYFNLFEFFSHKMTNSEFNKMIEMLMKRPYNYSRAYSLNSTPLNEGLLFMADYIGKFKRQHNVEKLSFITLTDGEGHAVSGVKNLRESEYRDGKYYRTVNYLRDPVTRREYNLPHDGSGQTRLFLRVIKHRYDASIIGFHVIRNSRRDMSNFIRYNLEQMSGAQEFVLTEEWKKELRSKDFALLTNTAHDELYLLPTTKTGIDDGELKVDENMNSRQIAKQFERFLDVKKTSRVLLNRFVAQVA